MLAALALSAVIPFASRAVFLDEHIFLKIAQSAQTRWMFPQETAGVFFGTVIPDFASHTHPPVGEYCLALIYAASSGHFSEIPFRLAFSIFPIVCIFAFYSLARRFTTEPLLVTALFGWSPAFFLYAPTLMMDVPMLAFLLAGFAFYFRHVDGSRWALAPSAACLTLAVGTGYTALIPVSCLLVCVLAARRPVRESLAIAIAPAALGVWLAAMTVHFGRFPLFDTARYFVGQGSLLWNLVAVFTFVGGVTVFPLAAAGKRFHPMKIFVACAVLSLLWPDAGRPLWLAALIVSGGVFLTLFLISGRQLLASGHNRGEAFLLLWAPATLIFFVVIGDMINARYILLAAPALFLVMFRETARRRLLGLLLPTGLLSVALAYADAEFVNANREFVANVVGPLQDQGERIYGGTESGLRFYLEQRSIRALTSSETDIETGSLIVRHAGFPFRYGLAPALERRLAPRQRYALGNAFPIRTFHALSGAGLHDSRIGLAPFTFSGEPFELLQTEEALP